MELWNNFNKLEILLNNEITDKKYIEYDLYQESYTATLTNIFRSIIENDRNKDRKQNVENRSSNIYAFIGRRGSGKTTAMSEICRILKNLNDREQRQWWRERLPEDVKNLCDRDLNFYVLKPIDASLLEVKEDLFELILVRLYKIYQDYVKTGMNNVHEDALCQKNVSLQFEKVIQMYRTVKRGGEEEIFSIASMLQFMGSSSDIAYNLARLTDMLVKFGMPINDCAYSYIVIAIDDLDLNIRYGYEMLEQLQKYFYYYKIIIVVAVDYDQMVSVCTQHFVKAMQYNADEMIRNVKHCRNLANNFMTKVFPFSQRVFLPDMKKITKKAQISLGNNNFVHVKQYIIGKIAAAMCIYYDGIGEKCHFCEPDTVRELVFYNSFLEDLVRVNYDEIALIMGREDDDAKEKKKQFMLHYDRNHQRFNWDIAVRQCQTTLNPQQQDTFKGLGEYALKRRAVYVVKAALERMSAEKLSKEKDCLIDQIQSEYTYGELLEMIYMWGRKIPSDKPLISCIIASFTSEMVREYISFRYAADSVQKEESRQRLIGFLGNSFGNKWLGECLIVSGKINRQETISSINLGFTREAEAKALIFNFSKPSLNNVTSENSLKKRLQTWMERQQIVSIIECVDMFLYSKEGDQYSGLEISFTEEFERGDKTNIAEKGGRGGQKIYVAKCKTLQLSVDIFAFVAKSLDYSNQRKRVHDMLASALTEQIYGDIINKANKLNDAEIAKEKVLEIMKEIIAEQGLLKEEEPEAALPFYNLDLVYNIMKRVRRKNLSIKRYEDIYEEILKIYDDISAELRKEKEYYNNVGVDFKYVEYFDENPYIKMFKTITPEVRNSVFDVLWNIASPSYVRPADTSDN